LKNIRRLGFETDLDEDALAAVSAHFRKIAEQEGLPIGAPREYDLFHFEHQVPGGMMTNLMRQLREIKMEHSLDEILEEVAHVRGELGYPVMATPYSQIVGSQAFENVIAGERYKKITDEVIKYSLDLYGKPAFPLDQNLVDKIMSLPRTKEFLGWKPQGYLKSIEELRQEIGPDLSDDDLLLKILIPGRQVKRPEPEKRGRAPVQKSVVPADRAQGSSDFPSEFSVDVDGEVFNVKIAPVWNVNTSSKTDGDAPIYNQQKDVPKGAVLCGMAGLVLSIGVKVGDPIAEGEPLAMIEAMKMRRHILSPQRGIVKELRAKEGEIVNSEDVLLVVA